MSRVSQAAIRSNGPQPPTASEGYNAIHVARCILIIIPNLASCLSIQSPLILCPRSQWRLHFPIHGACLSSSGPRQPPGRSRDLVTPTHSYASHVPVLPTINITHSATGILALPTFPNKLGHMQRLLPNQLANRTQPPDVPQEPKRQRQRNP
jgi:hypothetical protein